MASSCLAYILKNATNYTQNRSQRKGTPYQNLRKWPGIPEKWRSGTANCTEFLIPWQKQGTMVRIQEKPTPENPFPKRPFLLELNRPLLDQSIRHPCRLYRSHECLVNVERFYFAH